MRAFPELDAHLPAGETRSRLLDAAEQLFAENGFDSTSVRDITARAGCNVAAVNYHFGGKEALYREAFRRLLSGLREQRVRRLRRSLETAEEDATLELFLHSFASAFVEPFADVARGRFLMAFMDREMHNRHMPPEMLFDEMIKPVMEIALDHLERLAPRLDPMTARLCVMSLVGQLMHAIKAARILEQGQHSDLIPTDLDSIVDHIVRYAAGGIRACAGAVP